MFRHRGRPPFSTTSRQLYIGRGGKEGEGRDQILLLPTSARVPSSAVARWAKQLETDSTDFRAACVKGEPLRGAVESSGRHERAAVSSEGAAGEGTSGAREAAGRGGCTEEEGGGWSEGVC